MPYVATSDNGHSAAGDTPTLTIANVTLGSSIRWLIPTFALSLPGMLIVVAVAVQLLTGLTFVELTRRWLGTVFRKRRSPETGSRP